MTRALTMLLLFSSLAIAEADFTDSFEVFVTLKTVTGAIQPQDPNDDSIWCRDGTEQPGLKETWGMFTLSYFNSDSTVSFTTPEEEIIGTATFFSDHPEDGVAIHFSFSSDETGSPMENFTSRIRERLVATYDESRFPAFLGELTETRTTTRLSPSASVTCKEVYALYGGRNVTIDDYVPPITRGRSSLPTWLPAVVQ